MSYESIVLELMSRIKVLENDLVVMKNKIESLECFVETFSSIAESAIEIDDPEAKTISYNKMNDEMINACYSYGKKLHFDSQLEIGSLADKIFAETGMNRNSAFIYVYVVDNMLGGNVYKRAISTKATRAYLSKIKADYGKETLGKAIKALKAHIKYRQSLGHTVSGLTELCAEYEKYLH